MKQIRKTQIRKLEAARDVISQIAQDLAFEDTYEAILDEGGRPADTLYAVETLLEAINRVNSPGLDHVDAAEAEAERRILASQGVPTSKDGTPFSF